MSRSLRVAVLGSHPSMHRLVSRPGVELLEPWDPEPYRISVPLWGAEYARFVEETRPDVVLCIVIRDTMPACDAWIRRVRRPGTTFVVWGLDSYRHATRRYGHADRYYHCLAEAPSNPYERFLPVYAQPRPIVPLAERPHGVGIVCNRYGGWRDAEIAKVERSLDFAGNVGFDAYHGAIAGFRVGLNVPVHPDNLPNYRTFEYAAAGVWQLCPAANRDVLDRLFDHGITYYDRIEDVPELARSIPDYDPARLRRQVEERHTLVHRLREVLADLGHALPPSPEDAGEWTLEDHHRRFGRPFPPPRPAPAPRRRPRVSVVVPCFRSARFVERAVRSALAQTERDLEVVVVDNASDDATVEIARRLAREDARVRVEVNPENLGPVRNWRRGLALARGEYACLLFSDDWYEPTFVADALAMIEQDPGLGFVYSAARVVFETPELRPLRTELHYRLEGPAVRPSEAFLAEIFERGMGGVPVSPCAALWRTGELRGWLDTDLPDPHGAGYLAHGAGPDLWTYLQACRAHPRFGHLSGPLVNFSAHGDNLTFKPGIQHAYALARLAFLEAHRPFVDESTSRAQAWYALAADRRRAAAEPGMGLGAWLQVGQAMQDRAAALARDAEVEAAVRAATARDPRTWPGLPPEVFTPVPSHDPASPYRVTAIVSVYKATRFLRGCLEGLVAQTLHARGELEILVVDTGSPEDEGAIVREFQARSPHLRYVRTEDRRTLYAAWNLGVLEARGRYLTNANADDRHRPDALEVLANALDADPGAALAYADQLWTPVENETFAGTTSRQRGVWAEASPRLLRTHCMVGPQPMWRRELHQRCGLFDPTFASAGDWELWLRAGVRERFVHVPDVLGLYLVNLQGLEHSHPASRREAERVRERFGIQPWETGGGSHWTDWEPPRAPGEPLVSAVVLAGPSGELFTSALASVALQTERDLEIVVVETDHRLEAANVAGRLRSKRRGLRVRTLRHRGDATSARNAGIAAAAGRWILPLGPDDVLEPAFVEALLLQLRAEPMAAIAFGDRRRDREGGVELAGPFDEARLREGAPVARTALYHRNVLAAVGAFDPALGGGDEDRDLWLRCAARGVRATRAPVPLYFSAAVVAAPRARTA